MKHTVFIFGNTPRGIRKFRINICQ